MKKFITRGIYMTAGIQADLRNEEISMKELQVCIDRHFHNNGEECKEDNEYNAEAIRDNYGTVFSVFYIDGRKIYIITDGLHLADDPVHGTTYPMTTILYPEEY